MRLFRRKPAPSTAPVAPATQSWDWIAAELAKSTHQVQLLEAKLEALTLRLTDGLEVMEKKAKRIEAVERRAASKVPSDSDESAQDSVDPSAAPAVGWRNPALVASAMRVMG